MLTEDEARGLLASYVDLDQTWGAHSVAVARAAGRIAAALVAAGAAADPALARTGGLLHDIGRGVTHDFAGHAWAGSRLLLAAGHPVLARFCTTHQCGGLAPAEAPIVGWPPADYRPRGWEEKAVTIADGLAYGGRIVRLADRCADVRERYRGTIAPTRYALLLGVEAKLCALMAEVEAVTRRPTEALCGAGRL
ncbi:MAG TPA: HDIG domain-containing protein [Thermomicrobiales bacterium]|nr:HDIG domain-containing protein [Thermomicrobiales bacterium]